MISRIWFIALAPSAIAAAAGPTFCGDCSATRECFRQHSDYVLANKSQHKTIFIGGHYARTPAAGCRILGDRRYFDAAVAYSDHLLALQSEHGYWPTGYANIYLADTGSALGLFISLYKDVDKERQEKYFRAVSKYVEAKIPYVLAGEGSSLARAGDEKNDRVLWDRWPYDTSAYVGEGLLSFALYSRQRQWNAELESSVRPRVEWLLRTQNPDGAWAVKDSSDQKRSPGVINFLIWYHDVRHDPRVVEAVRKFDRFLLTPGQAKAFGLLSADGGDGGACATEGGDVVTSLTGRAIAEILRPGVDSTW